MSKAKDLALMTGLDKVYGCGALNWDIFFEVPSLDALKNIPSVDFEVKPGGEVAVSREKFLKILSSLEKQGKRVFSCGGGSAANTIFALSHLGFKTGFIGVCGDDEFGKLVLEELSQAKVDLSLVRRHGETSLALIVLDAERDRFIIVSPGSAEPYSKKNSFLARVKESS
jgi:Sugar kinases, ribokinase family